MTASAPSTAAELVAYAESLGLDPEDLDETVYETANGDAAQSYNDGDKPELDDEDAYEELHGEADSRASDVNNGGLAAQVEFLLTNFGAAGARDLLDRAAGRD